MEETRGITVKINAALHARAKADQEARNLTMNQYITLILEEHFNQKGGDPMNTRTMAFQIDEALFQRIKAHLSRTGLTQKSFVLGLIEQALDEAEAAPQSPDTEVSADDTGSESAEPPEDETTEAEDGDISE